MNVSTLYPPYIIERSSRGERTYDIFSRLLMDRIVFLGTGINDDVANIIIAQLLFLDADNPERDIYVYINSPGGLVSSGMAIYDTMQFLRAPVNTICMGMAASMGSFLLAAGRHGKRSALPHSRIMMHQPSGGTQGTAADIEIQAREILYLRTKLNQLYAKHTGKPAETIDALRAMMVDNVQNGPASFLKGHAGLTGIAGDNGDDRWFYGVSGDMAFAVFVANADGGDRAIKMADMFLRELGKPTEAF